MEKQYYVLDKVGRARHVVNFQDGQKTHKDGSPFWDITIFKNKKAANRFVAGLQRDGYKLAGRIK